MIASVMPTTPTAWVTSRKTQMSRSIQRCSRLIGLGRFEMTKNLPTTSPIIDLASPLRAASPDVSSLGVDDDMSKGEQGTDMFLDVVHMGGPANGPTIGLGREGPRCKETDIVH